MKSAATDDLRDLVQEARRRGAGSLFVWGMASVAAVTLAVASWQYAPKAPASAIGSEGLLATGSIPAAGANAVQARQVGGQRITTVPGASDLSLMQKDLADLRQDLAELKRALGRAELSFEQMGRRIDGLEDQTAVLATRVAKPTPLAPLPLPGTPANPPSAPAAAALPPPVVQPAPPPPPAPVPQQSPPRAAAPAVPPVAAKPVAVTSIEKTGDRPSIEAVPAPPQAAVAPAKVEPQVVAEPPPPAVPPPAPQPAAEARAPRVIIKPLSADPSEPAVRFEPPTKEAAAAKPAETAQPKPVQLTIPVPAAPEQAKVIPAAPVATVKIDPVKVEPPKPTAPAPKSAQALQAAQAQQLAQQILLQPQGASGLIPLPPQGQKLVATQPAAKEEQTASIPAQNADRTQFAVDLGGFRSMAQLRKAWSDTSSKHAGLTKGLAPLGQIKESGDQVEARLIAGPFTNALDAAKFCAQVKGAGTACQPSVYVGQALQN